MPSQKRASGRPFVDLTDNEDRSATKAKAKKPKPRRANVYDAVAGRVINKKPLRDTASGPTPRPANQPPPLTRATRHSKVLAPEEVLFRQRAAPERYAEHDIYMSHERDLDGSKPLPDSDLLKAVHTYSSHYLDATSHPRAVSKGRKPRQRPFRKMDGTALLAFGFLLEEAGRDLLGKKGDLVFTEGMAEAPNTPSAKRGASQHDDPALSPASAQREVVSVRGPSAGSSSRRKRRKVTDPKKE